jgi:hypothetical protein
MSDLRTVPVALLKQALELLQSAYVATALVWPRHDCVEALRAALEQPEPMCVGCEGKPTLQNSPCAVCGKIAQQEQGPVAWIQPDHLQKARQAPFLCRVEPTKRMADFVAIYTAPPRRETEQEPVSWMVYTLDGKSVLITDTPADFNKQYRVLPLYAHPAEPEPPPEPIHIDKIRAEFREMDRCCLPGEMTVEDWFTEGVRFAEKHHEIV